MAEADVDALTQGMRRLRVGEGRPCDVCCEPFTRVLRVPVACPYCRAEACSPCCRRYILGLPGSAAACMFCKKEWTRDFLDTTFNKAFLNGRGLKEKRQGALLAFEEALLPATQDAARAARERDGLVSVRRELQRAEVRLYGDYIAQRSPAAFDAWRACNARLQDVRARMATLSRIITGAELPPGHNARATQVARRTRQQFVKRCPVEGCNGFLGSDYRCGMCATEVCHECMRVRAASQQQEQQQEQQQQQQHVCDPADVATAKLLMRDTKPCPECATPIHKIDGCDQIWCTQCHTAFSWRTMRIETGRIHNPHWYEWLRQNSRDGNIPREPGDNPAAGACAQQGQHQERIRLPRYRTVVGTGRLTPLLADAHRVLTHIMHVEYQRFRPLQHDAESNRDLRIRFLLGQLSREGWKKLLQEREKRHIKEQAMRHVLEVLLLGANQILRAFVTDATPASEAEAQLDELRKYANACMADVIWRYNSKHRFCIDAQWQSCRAPPQQAAGPEQNALARV